MNSKDSYWAECLELCKQGKLKQMVTRCRDALSEARARHGNVHPSVAGALANLAYASYEIGDYGTVATCTKERLEIEKGLHGETSEAFIDCLINLARMNLLSRSYDDADKMLRKAHKLLERLPKKQQTARASILVHLALVHLARKKFDRAERYLTQAINLMLRENDWPGHILALERLSRVYQRQGKMQPALATVHKAIRLWRDTQDTKSPDYASMLSWQGVIQAELGQLPEAKSSQQAALEIFKVVRPAGHRQITKAEDRLAAVERQLHRTIH
jgi:tetratricopeptide (TPR) repeat protein